MALVTGKAGVNEDLDRGRKMLEHAAEKGDEQSVRMLYAMGLSDQVSESP